MCNKINAEITLGAGRGAFVVIWGREGLGGGPETAARVFFISSAVW